VLGILAVARSLGDHGLKEFVIGRPFVNTVEVDLPHSSCDGSMMIEDEQMDIGGDMVPDNSDNDQFVIVGCDGLWDVVEDQDAVDLVRDFLRIDDNEVAVGKEKKIRQERAAQMLCDVALRRGSADNVTVVVAWL